MKIPFAPLPPDIRYSAIDDDERTEKKSSRHISRFWKAVSAVTVGLMIATAAGLVGFYIGKHSNQDSKEDWLAPAGTINHTFHYRKKFAQAPTNETENTWQIIFPKGRGFIKNPAISPNILGVAVFHQLHCLDGLRHGYYAALDPSQKPTHHTDPAHMRHCIDYLRQSLMCAADTNLEPVDPDLGGATGWGFERKCRDIVRIKDWAEEWRASDSVGVM